MDVIKLPVPIIGCGRVMDFVPLKDYVLIEPLARTETPGGLVLPNGAKLDEPDLGRVIAIGPGKTTEYGAFVGIEDYSPGDLVYVFNHTPHIPYEANGKVYAICRDRDIIGKVKSQDKAAEPARLAA